MNNFGEKASFIWSVADLLRGPYRPNQYKDVMLPLTVLRRLDCVLEPTKEKVLEQLKKLQGGKFKKVDLILCRATGMPFYNTSRYTFEKLKGDPNNIAANLTHYIKGFSTRAREIIDHFGFEEHIAKMDKADRLYLVVSKFCDIDLHPDAVSNIEMGYIFEELIRRFNEASNEEAGDHFTPREVIRLMVNLLFMPDGDMLTTKGIVKTLFDPACGTGGMLSVADEYVRELNPDARLEAFGQDYNDQSYAICGSDMMIKGQDIEHIAFGDSFTDDHFSQQKFDYMLANPPFGVEWKPEEEAVRKEHEEQGFGGRFGAGLPRINDGSFLFLQHMISKMKASKDGGTRLGIVFNGSPLFTGSAGSGESEIRRWIIENDWLEAIVALPDQLFYNTGISTYLWIVSNRKERGRKGKIQLVDGTSFFKKMRKSLGNKRNEICEGQRDEITRLYGSLKSDEHVRVFDREDFGYQRITVERPLRLRVKLDGPALERFRAVCREAGDEAIIGVAEGLAKRLGAEPHPDYNKFFNIASGTDGEAEREFGRLGLKLTAKRMKLFREGLTVRDETAEKVIAKHSAGEPGTEQHWATQVLYGYYRQITGKTEAILTYEPDPDLRDYENVPLKEDVEEYMKREVLPHVPDAWMDKSKTKVGYEINFNRYFYKYVSPRPLEEIETDLKKIEKEISDMLGEVAR